MNINILRKTTVVFLLLLINNILFSQADTTNHKYPVLHYVSISSMGLDSVFIHSKLDSIANLGIKEHAFPGCQILAAKDGAIFFHKTYGFHTYDSINPVKKTDLYDWASVTKITGTLPAIMKLYDEGKLNLDTPFYVYWKAFKHSNKKHISLREILAHQARLKPWLPFWRKAFKANKKRNTAVIRRKASKHFTSEIAQNMYVNDEFNKKVFRLIKKSALLKNSGYRYSGLAFFIFPKMIENITGENYEEYIKNNFYRPLTANTVTYTPLINHKKSSIIPTEFDNYFRKQQIHGYVHDEGAAMMSGVSGNAGLFGTTLDLAKIMQMYQNYGVYDGKRYISDTVVKQFTSYQYLDNKNRRGLGFDKPEPVNKDDNYAANDASEYSFGHSGFTGTFCWADPKTGILFIFMSNRVYPTRKNTNLYKLNIRQATHQVVYDAILHKDN